MKTFNLKDFSEHLIRVVKKYPDYEIKASNALGEILEKEAKEKIGHLQQAAGQFEAWSPLAESTKRDKERLGYKFNEEYNPLYRTGELRDSIGHVFYIAGRCLYLGSTSEIMIYQELGTKYIPPRSVLGMTLFMAKALICYVYSKMLVDWISNKPLRIESK